MYVEKIVYICVKFGAKKEVLYMLCMGYDARRGSCT